MRLRVSNSSCSFTCRPVTVCILHTLGLVTALFGPITLCRKILVPPLDNVNPNVGNCHTLAVVNRRLSAKSLNHYPGGLPTPHIHPSIASGNRTATIVNLAWPQDRRSVSGVGMC